MAKFYQVTMPDESVWEVPVSVIFDSWWAYYKDKDFHPEEFDDDMCIEWARNDMNWDDVKAHARMVEGPQVDDRQEGWANGDSEVVERPE